jgi:nifR3 family TIM-barrel protein
VKNGEGSALMRDPELAARIVRSCVKKIHKPMTVKIRKGFNDQEVNAAELAKRLEDAGAAAIAVHGRTREQYYSGKADWSVIAKVKKAVKIPVIGNGDVTSRKEGFRMMEETGCDLVMIGRGSYGRPWVFEQVRRYFETGELMEEPDTDEKARIMLEHGRLLCELKGEEQGIKEMRKNVAWYVKGLPNSAKIRGNTDKLFTYHDMEMIADMIR